MALATFSAEVKIKNGLYGLNCAESNFAKIAGVVGKTRLLEGLSGQKPFDRRDADKMLEVLEEMYQLQSEIGDDIPIDWSRVDKVSTALVTRRVAKIAMELHIDNAGLQQAATQATYEVSKK